MFLAEMTRGRAGAATRAAWRRRLLLNIVIETEDCYCCQLDCKTCVEVSMAAKEKKGAEKTACGGFSVTRQGKK